jgi:hypothetical protein
MLAVHLLHVLVIGREQLLAIALRHLCGMDAPVEEQPGHVVVERLIAALRHGRCPLLVGHRALVRATGRQQQRAGDRGHQ